MAEETHELTPVKWHQEALGSTDLDFYSIFIVLDVRDQWNLLLQIIHAEIGEYSSTIKNRRKWASGHRRVSVKGLTLIRAAMKIDVAVWLEVIYDFSATNRREGRRYVMPRP